MIDKIMLGLMILVGSNLIVSSLGVNTQAIVLGVHTNTTVVTLLSLITGGLLGAAIRGLLSGGGSTTDHDEW